MVGETTSRQIRHVRGLYVRWRERSLDESFGDDGSCCGWAGSCSWEEGFELESLASCEERACSSLGKSPGQDQPPGA